MTEAGLTLSRQELAGCSVSLDESSTPTELTSDLARSPQLQDATIDAARDALSGQTWSDVYDLVEEYDLAAANPSVDVGSLLVRLGRGDARATWQLLAAFTGAGTGRRPIADARILPRLLALSDAHTPAVTVRVDSGFRDVRREHRETIAEFLAELAQGAAVRVVGTGLTLRWLATTHREQLPVDARLDTAPREASLLSARETLDADGPHTATLRALAD